MLIKANMGRNHVMKGKVNLVGNQLGSEKGMSFTFLAESKCPPRVLRDEAGLGKQGCANGPL